MLITMLCRLKKENIILFWYVVIDEDEGTVVFYGENCCEDFLDYLDELAVNEDGFEQSMVMLLFHNLKGYDGMFVFYELYRQHRCVENQVCAGIKVLCVTTGPIIFKESFCFFPFSLATFP